MNGASAEVCAKINRSPKTSSTMTIGMSHHSRCRQKKRRSSPAIPSFEETRPFMDVLYPPPNIEASIPPHEKGGSEETCAFEINWPRSVEGTFETFPLFSPFRATPWR